MRNPLIVLPLAIPIGAAVHLVLDRQPRSLERSLEVLLAWTHGISGVGGLLSCIGHTVRAREVAESIGWPADNPFQYEVAGANAAFGVLGVLGVWKRGDFWLASGIGRSVFLIAAGLIHVRDMIERQNRAPGNAGPTLYLDFAMPAVHLGLLAAYRQARRRSIRGSPSIT